MAMQLRHRGEFASRNGNIWRVDIMQEADEPFAEVEEMSFDGDEPVIISWDKKDKEDVICGSSATVKVISERDGQYQHLYTIAPGDIRMDIYWNGEIYWTGCLDPEFYEEPYTLKENYVVTLTFSDFGILDRMKFDLTGTPCLMDYVTRALEVAKIELEVSTELVSSYVWNKGDLMDNAYVRPENFADEDGEVNTWQEALEAVLQPMALKIIQKQGEIHLIDINGAWEWSEYAYENNASQSRYHKLSELVEWTSDDCELGADKVANSVTVSFSPYSDDEAEKMTMEYQDTEDVANMLEWIDSPTKQTNHKWIMADNGDDMNIPGRYDFWNHSVKANEHYTDFIMLVGRKGGNVTMENGLWVKIVPQIGNVQEQSAVLVRYNNGRFIDGYYEKIEWINGLWGKPQMKTILRSPRIRVIQEDGDNNYLLLKLDVLISARYNPWSDHDDNNNPEEEQVKEQTATFFVPCIVQMYDADGNATWFYTNEDNVTQYEARGFRDGQWKRGACPGLEACCWLQYWEKGKFFGGTPIGSWVTNRHAVGTWPTELGATNNVGKYFSKLQFTDYQNKLPDGELIRLNKDVTGFLEVKVLAGIYAYNQYDGYNHKPILFRGTYGSWDGNDEDSSSRTGEWEKGRWMMMKNLSIEYVSHGKPNKSYKLDDIDYTGTINPDAKDEIKLDTMCGVHPKMNIFAKGCYMGTKTSLMKSITRAGVTDVPERLLIRTLTAQYNNRHKTFKGTIAMKITKKKFSHTTIQTYRTTKVFSNKNPMAFYLAVEEEQNLADETAEVTLCEISPDREVEY